MPVRMSQAMFRKCDLIAGDLPSPPSRFSSAPSGENRSERGLAQQRDRIAMRKYDKKSM
jgi:hypothetical protein